MQSWAGQTSRVLATLALLACFSFQVRLKSLADGAYYKQSAGDLVQGQITCPLAMRGQLYYAVTKPCRLRSDWNGLGQSSWDSPVA